MPKSKPIFRVADLLGEEWKTPNTYGRDFEPLGNFPAVYAIASFDEKYNCRIAYIGMSAKIAKRFNNHHALEHVRQKSAYYQIWFKPVAAEDLRKEERRLIQEYDPPLNLIGKVVSLP